MLKLFYSLFELFAWIPGTIFNYGQNFNDNSRMKSISVDARTFRPIYSNATIIFHSNFNDEEMNFISKSCKFQDPPCEKCVFESHLTLDYSNMTTDTHVINVIHAPNFGADSEPRQKDLWKNLEKIADLVKSHKELKYIYFILSPEKLKGIEKHINALKLLYGEENIRKIKVLAFDNEAAQGIENKRDEINSRFQIYTGGNHKVLISTPDKCRHEINNDLRGVELGQSISLPSDRKSVVQEIESLEVSQMRLRKKYEKDVLNVKQKIKSYKSYYDDRIEEIDRQLNKPLYNLFGRLTGRKDALMKQKENILKMRKQNMGELNDELKKIDKLFNDHLRALQFAKQGLLTLVA
ncbi:hypothetical protein ROZALSC1DRAFT_22392 [Rozella allomycis CSF55]|uniref:AIG1-type G domain-containing protein n=1 Tax=Rozella allomycis (strain CSF55) TaxID=988480 RepID=A0A4P9YIB2_ROZAC|nr:hypothetical protein ROZALSC1DRAFT_22392 [Rozella allomycis CSF55]